MQIKEMAKRFLVAMLVNRRLTLSGELIINRSGMESVGKDNSTEILLDEFLNELSEKFPGLTVKVSEGICDLTIKMFTNYKLIYNVYFYNEFQKTLECYAIKINDIGNYNLRLNVYGEMAVFSEVEEFRYLNKNSIVSYKISAKQARFIFLQKLRKFLVGKILTTE